MEHDELVILLVLAFVVVLLLALKIIEFFVRFNGETRIITGEMRRARSDGEYRHWRKRLRCHYLCLIPFVNEKNVMRLYGRIFARSDRRAANKRTDGLYHMLVPSMAGVVVCAICLCGASWAWFTASQSSSVATIQSATYTAQVTLDGRTPYGARSEFDFEILDGNAHEVTLTADGSADSGYCKIELGSDVYFTPQLAKGESFTFFVAGAHTDVKITPQWGTRASSDGQLEPGATIGQIAENTNTPDGGVQNQNGGDATQTPPVAGTPNPEISTQTPPNDADAANTVGDDAPDASAAQAPDADGEQTAE